MTGPHVGRRRPMALARGRSYVRTGRTDLAAAARSGSVVRAVGFSRQIHDWGDWAGTGSRWPGAPSPPPYVAVWTAVWGLPTGYARKRERFEDTVVREVKEETGLDVTVGQLVNMKSGYKLRLEVAYAAELVGGVLTLDSFEVLEARWFALDELPPGVLDAHRLMIEKNVAWYTTRTDRQRGPHNDWPGPERTAQR